MLCFAIQYWLFFKLLRLVEHVFDVSKAFENMCLLSKNFVILIVPQFQMIHDYHRGYKDYWRFTPFVIDELFKRNNYTVLFRETTYGFSESNYLFYIATKRNAENYKKYFPLLKPVEDYLNQNNDGSKLTNYSNLLLK